MPKIVVTGVDSSETAAAAARKAAVLASGLEARLHILSAYGTFEAERIGHGTGEILVTSELTAKGVVQDVVVQLRKEFPKLEITYAPAEGNPAEALVSAADELGADVIVVGNKRVQGLARILGSIARDVAAHAPCDVYVAHTHQR